MELKQFAATSVKAIEDDDQVGTFEAIVSVFGNIDSYGDMVVKGAFADFLTGCKTSGYPPVVWTHQWGTVPIGVTLEMAETDEGLYAKGRLFIDGDSGEDHEIARQVYTAMRAQDPFGQSALREFSFGYDLIEYTSKQTEDDGYYWELEKLDVIEYGPCLKGANDQTRLVGVKSDAPPDGRVRRDHPKTDPSPGDHPGDSDAPEPDEKVARETQSRLVDLMVPGPRG